METVLIKNLLSLLDEQTSKIIDFVYSYIEENDFVLPTWANADNTLEGFYIPCNHIKLGESYKTELDKIEFNQFDKKNFYSWTIDNKYRANLSLSKSGKFGCSLIEIQTSKVKLNSDSLKESTKYKTIEIG